MEDSTQQEDAHLLEAPMRLVDHGHNLQGVQRSSGYLNYVYHPLTRLSFRENGVGKGRDLAKAIQDRS